MTDKFLIYLAGPITGDTWGGATGWRYKVEQHFYKHHHNTIRVLDPLRGKQFLQDYVETKGTFDMSYAIHPLSTAHGITKRDQWDVSRCDIVLVNFEDTPFETFMKYALEDRGYPHTSSMTTAYVQRQIVSIGTVMEIAWAQMYGKYILVAMPPDNIHNHGMLTESASLVVPTLQEAIDLVPTILGVDTVR